MPFFKTTKDILENKEYFDKSWMDSEKLVLPPQERWTYERDMLLTDVDIWEVIGEMGYGVYAAWSPFAEFYMVVPPAGLNAEFEFYYGAGAGNEIKKRMTSLGMITPNNKIWVENEDMWLYA